MRDIDELFEALGRSKFRTRFHLKPEEAEYLKQKTLAVILSQGRDFITARLAPANPANDGRQTPLRKHPIFIAQHATATCCRKCLEKWHHIPSRKPLTEKHIDYILIVIERWLKACDY